MRPEACVSVCAQMCVCVVHVGRENWFVLGTHHSFELQGEKKSHFFDGLCFGFLFCSIFALPQFSLCNV